MSKLALIAADMRATIQRPNTPEFAHRTLANGLELLLHRQNERTWRLALAREGVDPSDTEIAICVSAFNVPDGTSIAKRRQPTYHDKTRRQGIRHIAEMVWIEEPEHATSSEKQP